MSKRDLSIETSRPSVQQEDPCVDFMKALVCLIGQHAARELFSMEIEEDSDVNKIE